MRVCFIGAVVASLTLAAPLYAQNTGVSPLERLIETDFHVPVVMNECGAPAVVAGLARRFQFVAGVEYRLVECSQIGGQPRNRGEWVNFRGLSIRDALIKLSAMDPRYRWIELDGVVVIRPIEAWGDPKNILNYTTGSFTLDNVNFGGALDAIAAAVTGHPREFGAVRAEGTEMGARKFSLRLGATSVGAALDAIVREHGNTWWELRLGVTRPNELGPVIWIHTHDGAGLGVTTVGPRQR